MIVDGVVVATVTEFDNIAKARLLTFDILTSSKVSVVSVLCGFITPLTVKVKAVFAAIDPAEKVKTA